MMVIKLKSAVHDKDTERIEKMLKQNVSINNIDYLGVTPIFISARRGDIKTTAFLISKGAAIDVVTARGVTLLMRSIGGWKLRSAVDYDERIVKYLLDNGLKKMLHYKDDYGMTALMYACWFGTPNIVKWLLEAGANPNDTVTWGGNIPFKKEVYSGLDLLELNTKPEYHEEIRKLLIQYGAKSK